MKQKLFSLFLALVAGVGTMFAWNYERVQIGDLYYNLNAFNKTAEVTSQNSSSPYWSTTITTANIPASVTYNSVSYSVTSIGNYAFSDCRGLTSVTIPNSVISIGAWAFYYCSGLTSVTIPNNVTSIGHDAFSSCSGLTSITIPNSVTSIGDDAFRYCSGLTSVTIPNSVTSIGDGAFNNVANIIYSGSATGSPWGARSVNGYVDGYLVYSDDTKTTLLVCLSSAQGEIIIPNSVTSIGDGAFSGCSGLTSIEIPNSVTSIGHGAFSGCSGLTSIEIPNSVTSIGSSAFSYCSGLNAVHISDLSAWCNILFPSHNGNTANPLCYAHHLYLNNSEITNLIIPNSITHISANAFNGANNITSVIIPSSVVSIGAAAFEGCYAIRSVTCEGAEPPYIQVQDWYYDEIFRGDWGFNVYVPCGSLEEYKNAQWWKEYASQMRYLPFPYLISQKAVNGYVSFPSIDSLTICDESVQVTAIPDRGCYFVRWADGNIENPRTIELTQDTTMEAIFDYLLTGKCGKDSALTWTFEPASMALNITGKGALSENYTYGAFIESLTIGNEITSIGEYAFSSCNNLKNVIIGSSVKVLEQGAFAYCSSIETITCYSMRPPTVNTDALYGLDYSTIVYVPADYLNTYQMHDAWGLYDVRPLGAKGTETTDVNVTPAENTAQVAWPAISGAATYELVIKDKSGNVICTLVFNANGQLTQIAFGAPARNNAPQQTQAAGFSFTVTGLENGTSYDLTITSKDNSGTTLDTKTISFTTSGKSVPTDIDEVPSDQVQCTKVVRDGQIFILRGDKTYTLTGQETIMP